MADIAQTGLLGDVFEVSVAKILKQDVAHSDRGDKKVGQSVVINVGERGGHADSIFQADSCFSRDVLKLAVAKVAPELISAKLVDKINVEQAVAIHVGHRHS